MEVTPACYAHLLNSLLCLAGGKVAVVLEVCVVVGGENKMARIVEINVNVFCE